MKKRAVKFVVVTLVTCFVAVVLVQVAFAATTLLREFTGWTNDDPEDAYGGLVLSGSTLYGTSSEGGDDHEGTIYKIDTDGSNYEVMHEFVGGINDGDKPYDGLILSGSTLYGTTLEGGKADAVGERGTVFKIETDGTGFTLLHEFSGAVNGEDPKGALVLSGSTLYGTAGIGGGSNMGNIYKIDTDGSNFGLLKTFTSGNLLTEGAYPQGQLALSGSTLYGTLGGGCSSNGGGVFSIGTDGSSYTVLHSGAVGGDLYGSYGVIESGGVLYGLAFGGGTADVGGIYSIETDGDNYTVLKEFANGDDGDRGYGRLMIDGSTLYGMTYNGGTADQGVVFSIGTDGSNYTVLHEFAGGANDGALPYINSELILSNEIFYGVTSAGGDDGDGVIFSLPKDPVPPTITSISSDKANATYGATEVIDIDVTFSENVTSTGDVTVTLETGDTDRTCTFTVTNASTGTCNYIVQVGDASLDLNASVSGTIADQSSNVMVNFVPTTALSTNKDIVIQTNQAPTVAGVTGAQSTDGTGDVTIGFIMDDLDDDDTLQAKIEYSLDGGSTWADPTISTTGSETSATYGDPDIDNAQTYQIGQSGAYITTSSGANTVSTVWEAATDVAVDTDISNAQIRVTPYDGTVAGTASTSSNFELDVVAPTGLTGLSYNGFSVGNIELSWSAAIDTNFSHYEVWHGASQSDVQGRTGASVEWDDSDDTDLATAATTSTNIVLDPRNKYYKVFAIDDYGNAGTVTEIYLGGVSTGGSAELEAATGLDVEDYGAGVKLTWTDPDDDDSTHVQILRGVNGLVSGTPIAYVKIGTEYFADSDLEFGDTVTYQLRATNGSATGDLTDEVSFVVGSSLLVEEEEEEVEEVVEEIVEEEVVEEVVEEEEVIEEEEEEETLKTLADLGVDVPTEWSAGYLRWLAEDQNIVSAAEDDDALISFAQYVFDYSDTGVSRGGAVWLLATLTGMDLKGVYRQEFSDTDSSHDAYEAVQVSFEEGLVIGYEDETFKPDNLLNRAEAMKLLVVFFEAVTDGTDGDTPFNDVDSNDWYAKYVQVAYEEGLVSARGDGNFNPADTMTYNDFIKIVLLAKDAWGYEVEEEVVEELVEEEEIVVEEHWSKGYLENLTEEMEEFAVFDDLLADIVADPDKTMNRGEAVKYLVTLTELDVDTEFDESSFTDLDVDDEVTAFVETAYAEGLVSGYEDGTFKPEQVLNRVETLKFIMTFLELDVDEDVDLEVYGLSENPFSDVDLGAWYAAYVLRAYVDGVIGGYGDGTFKPANEVTYAEFVKMATLFNDLNNAVELSSLLE